jgi:transposase
MTNACAILYSFVETAKANGLLVDNYLQTCLNELAKKPESLEHLLPWNIRQG